MAMDYIVTYGVMTLDVLMLLVFFYIIFTNLPIRRISGAIKGILFVVFLWFASRALNFHMVEAVLSQIIQYGFLALIVLFPGEFRKLLDNIGRRRVFSWNTNGLLQKDSRQEVAEAVVVLARKKHGALLVIAREDGLDEESQSGKEIGEMVVKKEFIEMLFDPISQVNRGALIIKDDVITGTDARLPLANNKQLREAGAGKRHLAALGIVAKKDCMAIVVSADTGYITMIGYIDDELVLDFAMPLREYDLQDGIDELFIVERIEDFLKGKDTSEIEIKEKKRRRKNKKKREEEVKIKKAREGKEEIKEKVKAKNRKVGKERGQ